MNVIDFYYTGKRLNGLKILIKYYPTNSILRLVLKIINALNIITFNFIPYNLNLAIFKNLKRDLSNNQAYLLHKINQNSRIYILDFNLEDKINNFIKFTFSKSEKSKFKKELNNFNFIKNKVSFLTYSKISLLDSKFGTYLNIEPIDENFKSYNKKFPLPDSIYHEIENLRPSNLTSNLLASEIEGWFSLVKKIKNVKIYNIANKINPKKSFKVVAAHRDLGSENIFVKYPFKDLSDFTIIDWEFFTITAPELTDRVGVWLGKKHLEIKKRNIKKINNLTQSFLDYFSYKNGGVEAAVIALLHLADLGIDLAQILICYDKFE